MLLLVGKGIVMGTEALKGGDRLFGPIGATCLTLGITSILAARYSRDGDCAGMGA